MLRSLRPLVDLVNLVRGGGFLYTNAVFFAARVALDERIARAWLPPGVSLARPATAIVFAARFPETSFGSVYDEAGVFFHVRRRLRDAVFCPWMVVDDDVALVVGRELLGYPKKLARIALSIGEGEGGEVTAQVERRGQVVLRLRGRIGPRVDTAPPMLGQRALNVRGSLGVGSQRLVTFHPREQILEVRRATAEVLVPPHADDAGLPRDALDTLGLGAVQEAHLYRVNVGAGLPPRELRRVGLGFALRGLGLRWM